MAKDISSSVVALDGDEYEGKKGVVGRIVRLVVAVLIFAAAVASLVFPSVKVYSAPYHTDENGIVLTDEEVEERNKEELPVIKVFDDLGISYSGADVLFAMIVKVSGLGAGVYDNGIVKALGIDNAYLAVADTVAFEVDVDFSRLAAIYALPLTAALLLVYFFINLIATIISVLKRKITRGVRTPYLIGFLLAAVVAGAGLVCQIVVGRKLELQIGSIVMIAVGVLTFIYPIAFGYSKVEKN
ncbi:MAG: hypothetical protein LBT20_08230 [Clostridiales bacterium]|jgi:hypothetical protein|nr:hypothetical protein [Clostridiales bacterium]